MNVEKPLDSLLAVCTRLEEQLPSKDIKLATPLIDETIQKIANDLFLVGSTDNFQTTQITFEAKPAWYALHKRIWNWFMRTISNQYHFNAGVESLEEKMRACQKSKLTVDQAAKLHNLQEILKKMVSKVAQKDTLFFNVATLLGPILTEDQWTKCKEILKKKQPYTSKETQIFHLLKEVIKNRFTTKEPAQNLLPLIEQIFPNSADLQNYFLLADQLFEIAENFEIDSTNQAERDFIKNSLKELSESQFLLKDLQKTAQKIGRFRFLTDHGKDVSAKDLTSPKCIENEIEMAFRPEYQALLNLSERTQRLQNDSFEIQVLDRLSSALIRPNGKINTLLIEDSKIWVKNHLSQNFRSFAVHLNKTLSEIQYNSKISELLSQSQVPIHQEAIDLVRATCNIAPNRQIDLTKAHVNKAILSAILSPWRQTYFGSCHTTAPLVAATMTAIEVVITDLQELIATGCLTRLVEGKKTYFRAFPTLYPTLKAFSVRTASATTDETIEWLSKLPELRAAWELVPQEKSLKEFLKGFLNDYSYSSVTLQDIVDQMSPKPFPTILYYLNSRFQNPLMQSLQNGMMGMHFSSMHVSTTSARKFRNALRSALDNAVQQLHLPDNPFKNELVFSEKMVPAFNALRFTVGPPQTPSIFSCCTTLCLEDKEHQFHTITNADEFFEVIKNILLQIMPSSISEKDLTQKKEEITQLLVQSISQEMNLGQAESPWNFKVAIYLSPLFMTYLKTEEKYQQIQIKNDVPRAVEEVRNWNIELKNHFRNLKGLKIPTSIPEHICNALANEQMAQGNMSSEKWRQARENYLKTLSCQEPNVKKVMEQVVEEAANILQDSSQKAQMEKVLIAREKETFLQWIQRFDQELQNRFKKIEQYSLSMSERLKNIHNFVFQKLIASSKKIKNELVFKFIDTNFIHAEITESGPKSAFIYYAFALMPKFDGTCEWQTVNIWGDTIEQEELPYIEILQKPGPLYEPFGTKSLLLDKKNRGKIIDNYKNEFIAAWKAKKKPEELLKIKQKFQKIIQKFRLAIGLETDQELFMAMNSDPEAAGAMEALFSSDEKFSI